MAPASACKTWNQDADFLNPSPVLFSLGQDFLDALTFDEWLSDNLLIKHPLDMECAHWPNPSEKCVEKCVCVCVGMGRWVAFV